MNNKFFSRFTMLLFILMVINGGMTVNAEQNDANSIMQTRIISLESAMDRKTPDSVMKIYSNPSFKRNGAILFAIVSDNLKQAVMNNTYSPHWSMGVSSPYCKSSGYTVKTVDANNAEAIVTEIWGTSAPDEDTQIQEKLHLIKTGDIWLIDSVMDNEGTDVLIPNAKPANDTVNDPNFQLIMLGYAINKSTPEMTAAYYISAIKKGLDQCEYSVFTDRLATRLYRNFENENWIKSTSETTINNVKFTMKQMDENNVLGFLDAEWKTGGVAYSGRFYLSMLYKVDGWYIDNIMPDDQNCPLITTNTAHDVIGYNSYDEDIYKNYNDNTLIAVDNRFILAKLIVASEDGKRDLMIPVSVFDNVNINGEKVSVKINNVDCDFTLGGINVEAMLFSGPHLSFPAQEINGEVYIPLNTVALCFRSYEGNLYDKTTNIIYLFST